MKLFLVLAIVTASWAQSITVTRTCLPTTVLAGATLTCTDTMSGGNTATTGPAGIQWQYAPSQNMGVPGVAAGAATTAATKSVANNPQGLILISGMNQNQIADGVLAITTYTVPLSASCPGNSPCLVFTPSLAVGSTKTGQSIGVTINPTVAVSVIKNACDVNGDGVVNSADYAFEVNAVLNNGIADRNGDGVTNIQDVVIVGVAASGGTCVATQ